MGPFIEQLICETEESWEGTTLSVHGTGKMFDEFESGIKIVSLHLFDVYRSSEGQKLEYASHVT